MQIGLVPCAMLSSASFNLVEMSATASLKRSSTLHGAPLTSKSECDASIVSESKSSEVVNGWPPAAPPTIFAALVERRARTNCSLPQIPKAREQLLRLFRDVGAVEVIQTHVFLESKCQSHKVVKVSLAALPALVSFSSGASSHRIVLYATEPVVKGNPSKDDTAFPTISCTLESKTISTDIVYRV